MLKLTTRLYDYIFNYTIGSQRTPDAPRNDEHAHGGDKLGWAPLEHHRSRCARLPLPNAAARATRLSLPQVAHPFSVHTGESRGDTTNETRNTRETGRERGPWSETARRSSPLTAAASLPEPSTTSSALWSAPPEIETVE